jgi:hypothetical protein
MAGNWLADKLQQRQSEQSFDLGALRAARRFDPNNYERAINDLTGRVTSNASQRLAVAQGAGFNTRGLIIGGRRDTRDTRTINLGGRRTAVVQSNGGITINYGSQGTAYGGVPERNPLRGGPAGPEPPKKKDPRKRKPGGL